MPDLSIVIVNWNSADYLQACLASLYRNVAGIQFEVVVVDNASHDGCEEMLGKEFPEVQFFTARQNLGFARACNLGYEHSRGKTILFLNPDTEVETDAIQRMVAWLSEHPSVGALGARLLNTDRSLQENCVQAFPTLLNQFLDSSLLRRWFPGARLWGSKALLDPERQPAEVECISGACFMVRRDVFEAVGQFNADYFMYSDDLDLSYKIRHAGYSVVCLPEYEVIHHGGRSSSRRADTFADVTQRKSMAQFFRQTRGAQYSVAYRALTFGSASCRLSAVLAASPFAGARRDQLRATRQKWLSILSWCLGIEAKASSIGTSSHA